VAIHFSKSLSVDTHGKKGLDMTWPEWLLQVIS
jgi:hypothetical protein